jgi:hypothetical protein
MVFRGLPQVCAHAQFFEVSRTVGLQPRSPCSASFKKIARRT